MRSLRPDSFSRKDKKAHKSKTRVKRTSFEYWVAWLLFLALFFIFLTIFGQNGLLQIGELKKARKVLLQEVFFLKQENDALSYEIQGLNEDPYFIEKIAREELNLVRPNEVVYYIPSSSSNTERED